MKRFFTALAALVCLATTAAPASASMQEGFYAGGFIGANFVQTSKKKKHKHHDSSQFGRRGRNKHVDFDTGVAVLGFGGYRFCGGFRVEGELAYRYNKAKKGKSHCNNFDGSGSSSNRRHHKKGELTQFSYMVNGLYDIPVGWDCGCNPIVPYIGVGIGGSNQRWKKHHQFNFDVSHRRHRKNEKNGFAWQVIAGLSYVIDCNFDASLEYRFFKGSAPHFYNHAVGLAGKYHF